MKKLFALSLVICICLCVCSCSLFEPNYGEVFPDHGIADTYDTTAYATAYATVYEPAYTAPVYETTCEPVYTTAINYSITPDEFCNKYGSDWWYNEEYSAVIRFIKEDGVPNIHLGWWLSEYEAAEITSITMSDANTYVLEIYYPERPEGMYDYRAPYYSSCTVVDNGNTLTIDGIKYVYGTPEY